MKDKYISCYLILNSKKMPVYVSLMGLQDDAIEDYLIYSGKDKLPKTYIVEPVLITRNSD